MICNCNCSVLTCVALVYGPWVKSSYHTRLPNRSSVISEDQKINGLSPDFPWPSHIVVLYEYSSWYSGKYYSKYHLLCYKEFNSKEPIEGMYTVKYMEKTTEFSILFQRKPPPQEHVEKRRVHRLEESNGLWLWRKVYYKALYIKLLVICGHFYRLGDIWNWKFQSWNHTLIFCNQSSNWSYRERLIMSWAHKRDLSLLTFLCFEPRTKTNYDKRDS